MVAHNVVQVLKSRADATFRPRLKEYRPPVNFVFTRTGEALAQGVNF